MLLKVTRDHTLVNMRLLNETNEINESVCVCELCTQLHKQVLVLSHCLWLYCMLAIYNPAFMAAMCQQCMYVK